MKDGVGASLKLLAALELLQAAVAGNSMGCHFFQP